MRIVLKILIFYKSSFDLFLIKEFLCVMSKNVYIYLSDTISDEFEQGVQETTLNDLYGEDYVFIVCEDGSFITNEEGSSILIQEYF